MSLFSRKNNPTSATTTQSPSILAEMALATIHDGVIITDDKGIIQYMNPAAVTMTEAGNMSNAVGLDYGIFMKLETKEGCELADSDNELIQAMKQGQPIEKMIACLVSRSSGKKIPVAISLIVANNGSPHRIITFRNVTKELAEDDEQTEFISTASHEMRTPVASIEGYLSLALNPQTATIDARAKGYLESAHAASQHLGQLFRDLLDVTKLDDSHIKPHLEPVEMVSTVKQIADEHIMQIKEADLLYAFGTDSKMHDKTRYRRVEQAVYGKVDINFLREVMDNLIENAVKYTPAGGSIYINVLGDGDRALINVTDTGIGISSDDIQHIFQKFYRADNSDTRTIGGTGLGLYIVKKRVEAMGGRIWVESAFGEGSTFYVSLPRISSDDYQRLLTIAQNIKAMSMPSSYSATTSATPVTNTVSSIVSLMNDASSPPAPPAQPTVSAQPTQPAASNPPAPPVQPIRPTQPSNINNVNNLNGGIK